MGEQRSTFDIANRPTPLMVGVAVAILVVLAMASSRCSDSTNEARSSAGSWPSTPDAVLSRLRAVDTEKLAAKWGPEVTQKNRTFISLDLSADPQFQADIGPNGEVTALIMTGSVPPDASRGSKYLEDSRLLIATAAPDASQSDVDKDGAALAQLVDDDAPSSITLDGVRFTASAGLFHFTLRAAPDA